jgi:hypothetical protein
MSPSDQTLGEPIAPASSPIGTLAPLPIQSDRDDLATLSAIAAQLLTDPLRVRHLTDRVYQLLQEDLRLQQERRGRYGGR